MCSWKCRKEKRNTQDENLFWVILLPNLPPTHIHKCCAPTQESGTLLETPRAENQAWELDAKLLVKSELLEGSILRTEQSRNKIPLVCKKRIINNVATWTPNRTFTGISKKQAVLFWAPRTTANYHWRWSHKPKLKNVLYKLVPISKRGQYCGPHVKPAAHKADIPHELQFRLLHF